METNRRQPRNSWSDGQSSSGNCWTALLLKHQLTSRQQRQNYPSAATSLQKQRSRRPSWHWEVGKRQDQARYQQRPLKQTWKRWPTCYTVFSARSGRRKRYRLSGKEVSWLSCPRKETSGTATTAEGSCSCQCQTKCSTEFYWRGWKRQSTPSSETSRLASAETDHIGSIRIIVEQSLEWNSPLYINFIDYEKAFDSVDRETLWKLLRHYGVPEKIIALIRCTCQDMSCNIAHAVRKLRGQDWSPSRVPAVTISLPSGHRLDHEDHHNRQEQRDTVDTLDAAGWPQLCWWPGAPVTQPPTYAGQNHLPGDHISWDRTQDQQEENRADED